MSNEGERQQLTTYAVGTLVEARSTFTDTWKPGFSIDVVANDGYILRRSSDNARLPVALPHGDVRRQR